MTFEDNPYYNPEKCGLSIFDSIDTADSYQFDIFCIWKKDDDNTLWWETDSGCSCPTPFEWVKDLNPITADTFYNFEEALKNHRDISKEDFNRIKDTVRDHLRF